MGRYRVAMVRHGESEWTYRNLFCGWVDVGLTQRGCEDARQAGKKLKEENFQFDIAFTSVLKRAMQSLDIILKEIGQSHVPVTQAWELNERHYGALTGYNKAEMAAIYGEEQVQIWRRRFDVLPPPMEEDHKYYKEIMNNPKFRSITNKIPKTESLKTTMLRAIPFWNNTIVPSILSGKQVLIVCHGTSLRGIVKHLSQISDEAIVRLNLPTAIPFFYEFDEVLNPVVKMKFLSDDETVKKAMEKVASIYNKKE